MMKEEIDTYASSKSWMAVPTFITARWSLGPDGIPGPVVTNSDAFSASSLRPSVSK